MLNVELLLGKRVEEIDSAQRTCFTGNVVAAYVRNFRKPWNPFRFDTELILVVEDGLHRLNCVKANSIRVIE